MRYNQNPMKTRNENVKNLGEGGIDASPRFWICLGLSPLGYEAKGPGIIRDSESKWD